MASRAEQAAGTIPSTRSNQTARVTHFLGRFGLHLACIILGIMLMIPFYWAVVSSLKTAAEVRMLPPVWWPPVPQWQNYPEVWTGTLFGRWAANTLFLTVVATFGQVLSASLAGYSFARFRFPGRNVIFTITMATLLLPVYVTLIPQYLLFFRLGWLNTYYPLIVPYWFGGGAFFIFLFRQFFMSIPMELDEAARIDGASYPRILWNIIMPLSGPVYASAAIIAGISQWNSFLLPLIILNRPVNYPLSIGLRYFQIQPDTGIPRDHLLMAASVLMTLPIILLFFVGQRYFVRGVVMSGIKG